MAEGYPSRTSETAGLLRSIHQDSKKLQMVRYVHCTADQELSEEANYRETIRGVRSFMGWYQIPDFDTSSSSLDDDLFAGARAQPTWKISIKLPADEWLR